MARPGLIASYGSETIPEFASMPVDAKRHSYREITCDGLVPSDYHSLREIEPAADTKTLEASLPLDPGLSVKLIFVDPDGNPVRGVVTRSLRSAWHRRDQSMTALHHRDLPELACPPEKRVPPWSESKGNDRVQRPSSDESPFSGEQAGRSIARNAAGRKDSTSPIARPSHSEPIRVRRKTALRRGALS